MDAYLKIEFHGFEISEGLLHLHPHNLHQHVSGLLVDSGNRRLFGLHPAHLFI
jgi:hypothetical protein